MEFQVDKLTAAFHDQDTLTAVVPLTGIDLGAVEEQWRVAARAGADLVEWRLDYLEDDPDQPSYRRETSELAGELKEELGVPVLATYRSKAEGGYLDTEGPALARYHNLVKDSAVWADAVDVELVRPGADELIAELSQKLPVVASFHSHAGPFDPDFAKAILREMGASGATVAKLAWAAEDKQQAAAIAEVQSWAALQLEVPSVVIGMGPEGILTRLGTPALMSAFAFGTLGQESAPGQPTLVDLRSSVSKHSPLGD